MQGVCVSDPPVLPLPQLSKSSLRPLHTSLCTTDIYICGTISDQKRKKDSIKQFKTGGCVNIRIIIIIYLFQRPVRVQLMCQKIS